MIQLEYTIASAAKALKEKTVSATELVRAYLDQIRVRNIVLNAFLDVHEGAALEQAIESDERRAKGEAFGDLDGIPLAIKDNILIEGTRTTAGSRILETYKATNDSTVIKKLRNEGAVFLGKTNMDEFAMGSSTENSAYGPTQHPRDPERVPGGSSGGSACAVAADLCIAALGSDTGGSIRQPAAFCGIVGFKPSYGHVSRSGLIAMASSFDQIGPMTKSVEDASLLFKAIAGSDPLDQTTSMGRPFNPSFPKNLKGVRIGLPKQAWGDGIDAGVRAHVEEAIEIIKSLGAIVTEVDLPETEEALAVYYILMPCEVSANLERFDGIRYGRRETSDTLLETYLNSRGNGLGEEVRRRVMLGTYALSQGYYDAYYRQAAKVRALIHQAYTRVFEEVDILLTPTTPSTAFKRGEKTDDPLAMYLEDVFTVGANVAGVPSISLSCGDHEGLPVGLQMTAQRFADDELIDAAYAYEQARL
ncbi:Asp-tRNA(Asn)/Glu-tRNA(Gln) amidotransferase GatCAB subunit A [Candidatus Uhrbacteria bacterium CG22_combo_CG10-13_8_21_14_all_47_17]|uniref:Glutamyl-tRNA(Gln) amidotransferase subunit A n=1 Tax=Candidatus Uhrbacteria bacterium CG22_combo_CG10-13_8_21_14_all_47_17 TaxID=1975041 RepID=A0A2H0BUB2_9BACT|nr:MAG: Asp-tRNA(Asn)/Glu-tRNA(Gln) amidotransferase GatCAB subunit A [Candidatus Uhrbacteria bacterium CG22_combo_CG10-13_8_21_14_all_47_17]